MAFDWRDVLVTVGGAFIGSRGAEESADISAASQREAIEAQQQARREAQQAIFDLVPVGAENIGIGTQSAIDMLAGAAPQQYQMARAGGIAAQDQLRRSMPNVQAALLGGPIDYSAYQTYRGPDMPSLQTQLPQMKGPIPQVTLDRLQKTIAEEQKSPEQRTIEALIEQSGEDTSWDELMSNQAQYGSWGDFKAANPNFAPVLAAALPGGFLLSSGMFDSLGTSSGTSAHMTADPSAIGFGGAFGDDMGGWGSFGGDTGYGGYDEGYSDDYGDY